MRQRWAIVLAGGQGARLRHITRDPQGSCVAKQYWSPDGGPPLLRRALERAERHVPLENILVVVLREHEECWRPLLRGLPRHNIIAQPEDRGTAAAMALACLHIFLRDADAAVLVLPSDDDARDAEVLDASVEEMMRLCETEERAILLGMTPDTDDCGYGFVVPGRQRGETWAVERFIEKPSPDEAPELRAAGALWSSFCLAAPVPTLLLDLLATEAALLRVLWMAILDEARGARSLVHAYQMLEWKDYSEAVLQRIPERLRVLAAPPCGWTDLGTEARLRAYLTARLPEVGGVALPPTLHVVDEGEDARAVSARP